MRISIGWIAIFLLLSLSVAASVLPFCESFKNTSEKKEGFISGSNTSIDLNIQACPKNSSMYVDRTTGFTLCCDQPLENGTCPVKALCSLTKNVKEYPSCSTYVNALLEQKGNGRCFPEMPNYYEDSKTGVRGCCAGPRKADGTGPATVNAPQCRIYSSESDEKQRGDSCTNMKALPKYWPLAKFQALFQEAGCSRILGEGDTTWWRSQSDATVRNDMNAYASLTRSCKGTAFQHNFCVPGSCSQQQQQRR